MATALNVITGALKLLGVQPAESPVQATEAQDGLTALNDMMAEWEEDGIHTGFTPLATVATVLEVPDSALGAIKAKLALYIAPEYDRVVTPGLAARARSSFTSLRASLVRLDPADFPDTLPVGSGNQVSNSSGDGDKINAGNDTIFYPANKKRNF